MKWIRKSLTREIGLAALIIAVVLFASYYSLVSIRLRGYFMDQAERRLMDDSALASKDVEFYIKKYVTMMEQAKNNADFAEFAASVIDKDAKSESSLYPVVKKQLGSIAQLDPDIAMAYLALAKANDIISNTYDGIAISDYDLNKRTWYRAIVDNGKTTVTEPYLDLITGKMTMTIGAPMRYQGEFVGVCAVDITLASVERTMREYKIEKTGYVVLVYNDGHILYHPDYSVGDKATIADALGAEKAAELLSGKSGLTSCIYKGKSKFLYYQPIPDTNLTAVAVIAQTEAYSALNSF